jgi:molybdate transport system substrate-binding protein
MRRAALVVASAAAALATGCSGNTATRDAITVSAASSLKTVLPKFEPGARDSFAGSDELAAQIRAGARPDVFAAANTKLPQALSDAGLAEQPVIFATNRLVLAVPKGSKKVASLPDLAKPGVTIAAGAASVPVGTYTREVIGRLPAARSKAILKNIRSNEPDVAGVVGKLTQGAVDAGFVYVTDVTAAGGRLRAIGLPKALQPKVEYGVVVVKGAKHAKNARKFVARLRGPSGQEALRKAGFGPAP